MSKVMLAIGLVALAGVSAHGQKAGSAKKESGSSTKVELKVGDKAPNWKLVGSDGKTYELADYKGKQPVVVVWYPAALTGG